MQTLDAKTRARIEEAIYARRKIDAIKLYREAVPSSGLADAKKAVEDHEAQLKREKPENFGPPPTKSGCLGLILALAGLAGGLGAIAVVLLNWI